MIATTTISSVVDMLMTTSPSMSRYFVLGEGPATGHMTIKLSSRAMVSFEAIIVVVALHDVPLLIILLRPASGANRTIIFFVAAVAMNVARHLISGSYELGSLSFEKYDRVAWDSD